MSTWAVWRDSGGNVGVSSYPDTQLARYACNALGRIVLDFKDVRQDALLRAAEIAPRFAGGRLVYAEESARRNHLS